MAWWHYTRITACQIFSSEILKRCFERKNVKNVVLSTNMRVSALSAQCIFPSQHLTTFPSGHLTLNVHFSEDDALSLWSCVLTPCNSRPTPLSLFRTRAAVSSVSVIGSGWVIMATPYTSGPWRETFFEISVRLADITLVVALWSPSSGLANSPVKT